LKSLIFKWGLFDLQELSDTNETLADLTVQNQSVISLKRKLEQDMSDLRGEADDAISEAR